MLTVLLDYDLNDSASINSTNSSQYKGGFMSGALHNTSKTSISRRQGKKPKKNVTLMPPAPRAIQPQHQNWFARFLRIKPAVSVVCFQISKVRARKEIGNLLREWRKYGMKDIVVDKAAGRIWARVGDKNCKPAILVTSCRSIHFVNLLFVHDYPSSLGHYCTAVLC